MQKNVLEYLENTVKKYADKIAFADDKTAMSFSILHLHSKSIGTFLHNRGIYKQPVVIFMNRKPEFISALFGVVYAGNFYVPIDPEIPSFRIDLILQKINPNMIICDRETIDALDKLDYDSEICLYEDIVNTEIDEDALLKIRNSQIDMDLLYVVFTSGSTGMPKGVAVSHRSVIDYVDNLTDILQVDEDTVFGNQAPLYLDACIKDVYSTIKCGASCYIIPKNLFMFPIKLVQFLNEHKVNTICWVVSALTIISGFKVFDSEIPKHLKTIAFGSEVFPVKHFNMWRNTLPKARFINLYGPTETTGMSMFYEVQREISDDESIPIGKPFNNVDILLITEDNQLAKSSEMGEICIRGTAVSMGYYADFDDTDSSFVQNPVNTAYKELIYRTGDIGKYNQYGELVFVSRKDHQIKHMGHRIELGEIEENVNKLTDVMCCCCVYDDDRQKIVLYYVGNISSAQIITELKSMLPRYMIPNKTVNLEEMPLTANGKIDRIKLKNRIANKGE